MGGQRFSCCYDPRATIRAEEADGCIRFDVYATLITLSGQYCGGSARITYELTPDSLRLCGQVFGVSDARFVLPVIGSHTEVSSANLAADPEPIFFLTGGFEAMEYVLTPDEKGCFAAALSIKA